MVLDFSSFENKPIIPDWIFVEDCLVYNHLSDSDDLLRASININDIEKYKELNADELLGVLFNKCKENLTIEEMKERY